MAAETRWVLGLLLAMGCDPPPPMGGSGTSGGGTAESSTSDGPGDTANTGPAGDSSSGGAEAGCDALVDDRSACLNTDGCMWVDMFDEHAESTCGVDNANWFWGGVCAGRGDPVGERTTFYRELDGKLRYLVHGQGCFTLPGTPIGWTECTGAPGEPAGCQCLCVGDDCPWEHEALELAACELDAPCGELAQQDIAEPFSESMQCVVEALRDRTPGYYALNIEGSWWGEFTQIYSDGSDEVQMLFRLEHDQCTHPLFGTWRPTERCTLETPELFDGCLTGLIPPEDCMLNEDMFTNCTTVEPACP